MVEKTRIFLDTNFLIECFKNKIDILTEIDRICHFPYEIMIVDTTIQELEKLKIDPKTRLAARLALIYTKTIPIIPSPESVARLDDALVALAGSNVIIATHDKELKKRLHSRIIVVRQNKYLQLQE